MKNAILDLLKKNTDDFLSGQIISDKLKVSRTAIWKYINNLRKEGYIIDSSSKKGYRLISSPDIITYDEIKDIVHRKYTTDNFIYFDSIDSTNMAAKKLAEKGAAHGTVIVAEEQTMGRGRLGRSWMSPKYKGIWLSIILRPNVNPIEIPKITQLSAASLIKALNFLNIPTKIKWPNDIVIGHKKVCGILTEMSGELNRVNYVIVGIGINANLDVCDFKDEIAEKATSLKIEYHSTVNRKIILANLLNEFEKSYEEFKTDTSIKGSIEICKKYSAVLGKDIRIIRGKKECHAKALDIAENGELVVEYPDGTVKNLISGEISIRGLNEYI